MKAYREGYADVLVCNVGGRIYAVANECSQDCAEIYTGRLFKEQVVCPRHGARFNVATGAVEAPPAILPLDTYEVKVEGEDIYVAVE